MALGALGISLFWNGIVSIFVLFAISGTLHVLGIPTPEWFPAPKMNGDTMNSGMVLFLWLFLTPFILIGSAMIGAFLSAVGGRTEVRLDANEGTVFVGIGPLGWKRRFNPRSIKDIRIKDSSYRDSDGDRQSKVRIRLETADGKEIEFGSMLRPDRMKFVAGALRKAVGM
jgi:hypothetical protein